MANLTSLNTNAELFNNIIVEAQYTAQENSVMRPLVNMYPVANAVGNVVQIPKFSDFTIDTSTTEGGELTAEALSMGTSVTITMAERAAMSLLTDDAVESLPNYTLASEIGKILGQQMASQFDIDAMAKFANFKAANDIGSTASPVELTADSLFQAAAILRTELAGGQMVGIFHPKAVYNLKKQLTNSAGSPITHGLSDVGNTALSGGYVTTIAGITIIESTLATVGGVFTLDAMGGAMKRDVRLEMERDASKRATEVIGSAVWGFEAVKPENGVAIFTENVIN